MYFYTLSEFKQMCTAYLTSMTSLCTQSSLTEGCFPLHPHHWLPAENIRCEIGRPCTQRKHLLNEKHIMQLWGLQATAQISAGHFSVLKLKFDHHFFLVVMFACPYIHTHTIQTQLAQFFTSVVLFFIYTVLKKSGRRQILTVRESPTAATTLISPGLSS